VLLAPLVVVLSLSLSDASGTNIVQLVVESLRLGTPIALGAMCGLWCERSGVVNIGIEGMMLASAGVGFTCYAALGDANSTTWLWISILIAILTGGLIATLHAVVSVSFRVDQIISGVVINLLALGVTGFLRSEIIVPSGVSTGIGTSAIGIPLLSQIPVLGKQLFTNKPIFFLMFLVVTASWFVLWKTPWGLRIRSCGENPHAAETLGIDVIKTRYQAVIVGGLIAGLAGAWFSMETQAGFEDGMTNGAGFIALAALIFGKWKPWSAFAGAMLFGFTRALGTRLQILDVTVGDFSIPSEFWQSLPYVVTIIVVAGAIGRAVPPAADGQPFKRSR
jgi:simple sugar transport system permease protein